MREQSWREKRDSRSIRYAGRVFDPDQWICIRANAKYAEQYDGQVAIITAANLLSRMTPSVTLDIPNVPVIPTLSFTSGATNLHDYVLDLMPKSDPYGRFNFQRQNDAAYTIHLGPEGSPYVAHGSGWNVYLGQQPSPLIPENNNPIGPALSAILAVTEAFKNNLEPADINVVLNALTWNTEHCIPGHYLLPPSYDFGNIWTVGTGSVGSAILYFLTFATNRFSSTLFDMDYVDIHNLDRSPIFTIDDIREDAINDADKIRKVASVANFLRRAGVLDVSEHPCALDESPLWNNRTMGEPDILISSANERNVRSIIEEGYPPVQIYGTTGKHWQAAVIRHSPLEDPCSACIFPDDAHIATKCAAGSIRTEEGHTVMDAALPFLSFAAGAMAAAEVLKMAIENKPVTPNRTILNTAPSIDTVPAPMVFRPGCICRKRDQRMHIKMLSGSKYAKFGKIRY